MIEFLMLRMKEHMDIIKYENMLSQWSKSSSDTHMMQLWVDDVRSCIGGDVYENIKKEFIELENKRNDRECSMNCTETFSNPVVVQFKKDIGAENDLTEDIDEFLKFFEISIHGISGI